MSPLLRFPVLFSLFSLLLLLAPQTVISNAPTASPADTDQDISHTPTTTHAVSNTPTTTADLDHGEDALVGEASEADEHAAASQRYGWVTAVGSKGTIFRTTDAGNSWALQDSGTKETLLAVHFHDARSGVVVGANGTILFTENGGSEWQFFDSRLPLGIDLYGVHMISLLRFVAVGSSGYVARTVDSGTMWIVSKLDIDVDLLAVKFVDLKVGFAVGTAGVCGANVRVCDKSRDGQQTSVLFRTSDGGESWQFIGSSEKTTQGPHRTPPSLVGLAFADTQRGYAFSQQGDLLITQDGGTSWQLEYLSDAEFRDAFTSASGVVLCGYRRANLTASVFYYENGGWSLCSSCDHLHDFTFTSLFFLDPDEAILASSDGGLHLLHTRSTSELHTTVHGDGSFVLTAIDGQNWHSEMGPATSTAAGPLFLLLAACAVFLRP